MQYLKLVILVFLMNSLQVNAQNWRTATPYNGRFNDIVFVSEKTGYACGLGAGIGNCSASGLLVKTIDGGITWTRMNTNTTYELYKLHFIDAFTGWALGNSSLVLKTTDGGVSWVQQTSGIGAGLNDLYFSDANNGFICGQNGILRKSTNGGATFTTIASGISGTIYGVQFVNPTTGFIIGDNGVIRKSVNGGTSFSNVYSGPNPLRDLYFFNPDSGFVIAPNKILKTVDGGSSWSTFNITPGSIITKIHFVSANVGFVIGDLGFMLKTIDGGNTWNPININSNAFINSISFIDENTGFYGRGQGQILKTINGGITWNSVLSGLSDELYSVDFRDRETGVTVGKYGDIFQTKNGGLNWTIRRNQGTLALNRVRWITDEKVITVGDTGIILLSTDHGLKWDPIDAGISSEIIDIQVLDTSTIFMTYGTGKLMKSLDGGVSWDTTLNTFSAYPLTGVFFQNRDTGFVCGANEVYRTYDAGASWTLKTDSIIQFASFNDIYFTSPDTGYVAGTFGQVYRTFNRGEWWEDLYPSNGTNAEVNEMQFVNNDTGYFAGSTSQRITVNAGVNLNTLPTYCLANNWETHSIDIPEPGYGYCVGGQSGLLHTVKRDSIYLTYLEDSIFCSGSRIFVGYLASNLISGTPIIDVELSDASGSFAAPVTIGSFQLYTPMINPSAIATCTLPIGINGTGFRIRAVCSNPVLTGPDNGYDLTITNNVIPTVNLSILNSKICQNDTLHFLAQSNGGGTNPDYIWFLDNQLLNWDAAMINLDTLQGNHTLRVTMTSSLTCAAGSATDSIQFSVSQSPNVNAGSDFSVCVGTTVTIGSVNNSGQLQWFPNVGLSNDTIAQPTALPDSTQEYVLTNTNGNGCVGYDTILVNVNPLPDLQVSGNSLLCDGDSTLLTASSTYLNTITWTPTSFLSATTGTSVFAFPPTSLMFYATLINDSLCTATDSIFVDVLPPVITPVLNIYNTSLVVTVNTDYLVWYLNGVLIQGFTADTLHNPANGIYYVVSTDTNGCSSTSQTVIYALNSLSNTSNEIIQVLVHDKTAEISISQSINSNVNVNFCDLNGRILIQNTYHPQNNNRIQIDISNFESGIYFMNIQAGDITKSIKIIVM